MAPTAHQQLRMYDIACVIKQCDERFRTLIASGEVMFQYYSPRGQEIIAAAMGVCLEPDDLLVTTYRGLHDHVAKGVELRALWAEFLGRADGTCRGKGGPMHLTAPDVGVMVTTGVVGSGLPIANGLAMASQLRGEDRVTVVCFGDGASNIGAFHEALNLAALWQLPTVFLCQNNRYAEATAFALHQRNERVAQRAAAYGMEGVTVDGNEPTDIFDALDSAIARARAGEGPTLVEAMTYRFHGHYFGDSMVYQPAEEREAAMVADPLPRFRHQLLTDGIASEDELTAIEQRAVAAVADAEQFALASPAPDADELDRDVYGCTPAADEEVYA